MGLCDYFPLNYLCPFGKTTLAVFTYSLDSITSAGRDLIDQVIKHPYIFGISAALIVGGILFLLVPIAVGFGPLGPIAGSLAALWQSYIGNVVAASLFAALQSLTMTGVFNSIGTAMIALGVLVAATGFFKQGEGAGREEHGLKTYRWSDDSGNEYGWKASGWKEHGGKMYAGNLYAGEEIGDGAGGATEIMTRAADFAAECAHYRGSADTAEIIARAADFAASSEFRAGAAGVVVGAAGLAARYGVKYYPPSAADMLARANNLGEYSVASASASGMMARVGQLAGLYGFRMV